MHGKKLLAGAVTAAATGAAVIGISVSAASSGSAGTPGSSVAATAAVATGAQTTTPIKHVVVLFDENISFDHYFGTYPNALNKPGEPSFEAKPGTPSVNGLNNTLLEANPNSTDPQRLGPDQALTCDMNHGYTAEQQAFDTGLMDKFNQDVTGGGCTQGNDPNQGNYGPTGIDMDYYDGNTVTALWNYAQNYTLSDNSYDTQFGPSSPGAINVVSGNTHGAVVEPTGSTSSNVAGGTLDGDIDPFYDQCSGEPSLSGGGGPAALSSTDYPGTTVAEPAATTAALTGANIGDLLNRKSLTWGWFQGGFTPSSRTSTGQPVCNTVHNNIGNSPSFDYSAHHNPFEYYKSTANPQHLAPDTTAEIGTNLPAGVNHQYDLTAFNTAVDNNEMPAVSYLKAPEYQDGHAGYSDPLDEQQFLVSEINQIEQSPSWSSTAIFIAYDDSDGWYDHQMGQIIRPSADMADALNGPGKCGSVPASSGANNPVDLTDTDRCGVGPRTPLLVISPYAKSNFVDSTFTEQASIPKFIEQNWGLSGIGGESADASAGTLMGDFDFSKPQSPQVILDPTTGEVVKTVPPKSSSSGTSSTTTSTTTSTTSTVSSTTSTTGSGPTGPGHGGSGSSPSGKGTVVKIRLPKVTITIKTTAKVIKVTTHTKGGSNVATAIRMRLRRANTLIANQAKKVRNHKATFTIKRGKKAVSGKYKVTATVDAGGAVAAKTESLSIR